MGQVSIPTKLTAGAGLPAGPVNSVQVNSAGFFASDPTFQFDLVNHVLKCQFEIVGNPNWNANPFPGDPPHLLEVCNDNTIDHVLRLSTYGDISGTLRENTMHFCRYGGTLAAPTALVGGMRLSSIGYRGYDGTALSSSSCAHNVFSISGWSVANHDSYHSFEATKTGSVTRTVALEIKADSTTVKIDGNDAFKVDASKNVYGTALHNNATAPTGTVNQYIASGTYTPTGTIVSNIDAATVTMEQAQWMRVGNVCTVSGRFLADPTLAATLTRLDISLPIPSNLINAPDCSGIVASTTTVSECGGIIGNTVSDNAQARWLTTVATAQQYFYTFTYLIE